MAEISVIPIGTGGPSVGKLVADALKALDAHPNVRHELSAMGTTLTGELNDVLLACGAMSSAVLAAGSPRCYTIIKLDQRADKSATAEEKVSSVLRHLSSDRTEQ
jgi:uncharacterized protein (TIGR00106 family)